MAQAPEMIPEGERLPAVYPVEYWTEQVESPIRKAVKKSVPVIVRNDEGLQEERMEERTVYTNEVELINEHYVKWMKKGDSKTAVVCKVRLLKKLDPSVWKALEASYRAWVKGEEIPETGNPLENWPMISNKKQVAQFKLIGIRTVEDLAQVTDGMLQDLGTGSRSLRDRAKAYVQAKGNEAQFASLLTTRDEEIEKLTALTQQLAKDLEIVTRNMPEKKRPSDIAKAKD